MREGARGVELDPEFEKDMQQFIEDEPEGESGSEQEPAASPGELEGKAETIPDQYDPVAYLEGEAKEQQAMIGRAQQKYDKAAGGLRIHGKMDTYYDDQVARTREEGRSARDQALKEARRLNGIINGLEAGDPQAVEKAQAWFSEKIQGLEEDFTRLGEEVKKKSANLDEMRRLEQTEGTDYGVAEYDRLSDRIAADTKEMEALQASGSSASGESGQTAGELKLDIAQWKKDQQLKGYGNQAHQVMGLYRKMNELGMTKDNMEKMRSNVANQLPEQRIAKVA